MQTQYLNVLFRMNGEDYTSAAMMFVPTPGECLTLHVLAGAYNRVRVLSVTQSSTQTIVDIEEAAE